MGFDRGWAYGQPSGDLRIVQPFDHQSQNFTLALRQGKAGRQAADWLSRPGLERPPARAWRDRHGQRGWPAPVHRQRHP